MELHAAEMRYDPFMPLLALAASAQLVCIMVWTPALAWVLDGWATEAVKAALTLAASWATVGVGLVARAAIVVPTHLHQRTHGVVLGLAGSHVWLVLAALTGVEGGVAEAGAMDFAGAPVGMAWRAMMVIFLPAMLGIFLDGPTTAAVERVLPAATAPRVFVALGLGIAGASAGLVAGWLLSMETTTSALTALDEGYWASLGDGPGMALPLIVGAVVATLSQVFASR